MAVPLIVTGNLKALTNGSISQGFVIFQLGNLGTGNPIIVSGTAIFPSLKVITQSAADGSFSQTLWGNDNISPSNTIYNVTFRDLQGNEIGPIQYSLTGSSPNLNTLSAVSNTTPPVLIPGGSFVFPNQNANTVYAGPTSGPAAGATFRSLVGADLPNPSASTLGGVQSLASVASKWISTISTSGVPSATQPAASDLSNGTTGSGAAVLGTSPAIASPTLTSPALTTPTIGGGSTITRWNVVTSASLTFSSIPASSTSTQSQTITGVQANDKCMILAWGTVQTSGAFIASLRVTGANTVAFDFVNGVASPTTPTGGVVTLLCIQ
jgi:hypothetical protein